MQQYNDRAAAAAHVVMEQLATHPMDIGIPLELDVAEFLGAFHEDAVSLADLLEDGILKITSAGEVYYDGE